MGPIFLVHLWTFLVKIAYGLTFFLFLDRKRTKLSPKLISLRIFGNFLCADKAKKKGSGCPQSQPRVDFLLSPLDWGGGFFVMSQFFLWASFVFDVYSGSNISIWLFWQILFKTVLFLNSLQTNFRFWHLIVWLDKFKLKEGPENWSSGAFETDDFGWNLSKNAIFG